MAGTGRHRNNRRSWLWDDCALRRHQLLLTLVGAACVALGIVVAVMVPDSEGPAWAMAVAGCLGAGVLLLARVLVARFRSHDGATP